MASVRHIKGRYYGRWRDEFGHRVERALEASSLRDARREAEAEESKAERIRKGREEHFGPITFNQVWAKYAPIAKSKASWYTLNLRFKTHILPEFGTKYLHQVRPADIERFMARVMEEKGLSPQTARHLRTHLSALYTFAIKRERVFGGENPARIAEAPHVPQKPPRFLEVSSVEPIIQNVFKRWRNLFAVAVYTGMRAGELRGLQKDSVDLQRRLIFVWRSNGRDTTKSGKMRVVPLSAEAIPYVQAALDESPEGSKWVFTSKAGKQVPRDTKLAVRLRQALKKSGLKADGFAFKDLRATFATHSYESSGDIRYVQRVLGHSDPRLTERVYAGLRDSKLLEQADRLSFRSHTFPTATPTSSDSDQSTPKSGPTKS